MIAALDVGCAAGFPVAALAAGEKLHERCLWVAPLAFPVAIPMTCAAVQCMPGRTSACTSAADVAATAMHDPGEFRSGGGAIGVQGKAGAWPARTNPR